MRKILHVVESFGGGVFSFLVDLINGIDEDYEVVIAYGKRKETLENFKEYFNDNVKFIEVKNFDRSLNPIKAFKAIKEVKKIIKEENPNIIHLHSSFAGMIGRLAISAKKIKMFYNPHGFSFLKKDDSKLKRLIYWWFEKIAAIINKKCTIVGCSYGEYEEAKKINKNSICINNGINIDKIKSETQDLKEKEVNLKNIKICTIGRIGYQKNPEMFNEIAKSYPDIEFTWIGEGDLRDKLVSKNIRITGWLERKDVLKELNKCDIFLLTSLWEGLPISLLESMFMKKICIVSNCIGNRDVIKNNYNGFIANNLEEYKKTIKNIINEKEDIKLIKENTYEDLINNYNINIMIKKYKEVYRN